METATRELYWNISGYWIMYILFALVVLCFVVFFYRRYRLWKLGAAENRSDNRKVRLWGAFADVISQRRVVREKGPGIMHLAIFWAMLFCFTATCFVALQADFGFPLLYGPFYLYFISLAVDLAGFVGLIGVTAALIRRISKVNKNLDTEPADIVLLILLWVILFTGFMTEGLRIMGTNDPWAYWSPIGYVFSLGLSSLDEQAVLALHQGLWWVHMILAFAFLATFTYTKIVHALFIPGNVYFRSLKPKGTIEPIDFEDENLETMGVRTLEEFTWKDIYDTQACIRCGRCQANCPAYQSGKELSPKNLICDMRKSSEERGKMLLSAKDKDALTQEQQGYLDQPVVGNIISEDALWQCTTCRSCAEQCPARIEQPEKIIKLRTYQVSMESSFPPEAQQTFRNMETNGNPWGIGWQKRVDWTKDLNVPTIEENPTAEYLYWPGCSGAYDSRSKKVATAFVKLMQAAGVDFAILGNTEKCCGDSARRLGNEYLYYLLASENIETLNSYGVKKIVTQCPHCMHALSVDYPQMGGHYQVIHHSQLLAELIAQGKLKPAASDAHTITYHDSCYLGRYHDIFEQPRKVLESTGARIVEMDRNHSKSFCCGAGGGHMWLEEKTGNRINNLRAEEALSTHAEMLVTACPFCLTMLSDGVAAVADSTQNNSASMPVKDMAEVLADVLSL